MSNLKLPAYPVPEGAIYSGYTKLERAALVIAAGMASAGDWLQEASPAQYKLISEVATALAKAVLEEANK